MYTIYAPNHPSEWTHSPSITPRDRDHWQLRVQMSSTQFHSEYSINVILLDRTNPRKHFGVCNERLFDRHHRIRTLEMHTNDLPCLPARTLRHGISLSTVHHQRKLLQQTDQERLIVIILAVVIFVLALVVGFLMCYFGFFNEIWRCLNDKCFGSCAKTTQNPTGRLVYNIDHKQGGDRLEQIVITHNSPPTRLPPPDMKPATVQITVQSPSADTHVSVTPIEHDFAFPEGGQSRVTVSTLEPMEADRERFNTLSLSSATMDGHRKLSDMLYDSNRSSEPSTGPSTDDGRMFSSATNLGQTNITIQESPRVKENQTPLPPPPRKLDTPDASGDEESLSDVLFTAEDDLDDFENPTTRGNRGTSPVALAFMESTPRNEVSM